MNIIGFIAALFMLITGKKPYRVGHTFVFAFGKGWGGLTLGAVVIVAGDSSLSVLFHEYGHTVQNLIFGPFELFIGIASAARYWYREIKRERDPACYLPPYDSIWFEGQATRLGLKFLGRYGK
jgi:hypothetical protein